MLADELAELKQKYTREVTQLEGKLERLRTSGNDQYRKLSEQFQ